MDLRTDPGQLSNSSLTVGADVPTGHPASRPQQAVSDGKDGSGQGKHCFAFRDCTYTVKTKEGDKALIKGINGTVKSGEVLAIMGPSGAGKTTLLNLLTLTKGSGTAEGTVTLNGQDLNPDMFRKYCALVTQSDNHWAFLTAREVIEYAADLYLSDSADVKKSKVDHLIKEMGLTTCEHTRCGNQFIQGLSGGQKRRLSLAVALIKEPMLLFLDEPTSGLDAAAAAGVMGFLKDLASSRDIIVVCTIHQPSKAVFDGFDGTMILSGGKVAYCGPAAGCTSYLNSIGKPLPRNTNPAEYWLNLVNREFTDPNEVDKVMAQWEVKSGPEPFIESGSLPQKNTYGSSFMNQVITLLKRHSYLALRDPSLYGGRAAMFLISCCFFSVIYWNARERSQEQAFYRLWLLLWFIGVPASLGVIAVFALNMEFVAVKREIRDGMFSPGAYLIAQGLLQIPMMIILAVCATSVSGYGMSNFNADNYVQFTLTFALCLWVFECQAQQLSVQFLNPLLGTLGFLQNWFAAFLFGGIMVPTDDVIWPFRLLTYISPIRWSLTSLTKIEYGDSEFSGAELVANPVAGEKEYYCPDLPAFLCYGKTGNQVLDSLGQNYKSISSEDTLVRDSFILLAIAVFFKLAFMVDFTFKTKAMTAPKPPKNPSTVQLKVDGKGQAAKSAIVYGAQLGSVYTIETTVQKDDDTSSMHSVQLV